MYEEDSYVVELAEIEDDCRDQSGHLTPSLAEAGSSFRIVLSAEAAERGYAFVADGPDTPYGQVEAIVFHERPEGDPWDWVRAERVSDTELSLSLRAKEVVSVIDKVAFDLLFSGPCGGAQGMDPVVPGIGIWK